VHKEDQHAHLRKVPRHFVVFVCENVRQVTEENAEHRYRADEVEVGAIAAEGGSQFAFGQSCVFPLFRCDSAARRVTRAPQAAMSLLLSAAGIRNFMRRDSKRFACSTDA